MEHNQQHQRRSAAREFLKSLEQLEDILHEHKAEEEETSKQQTASVSNDQQMFNDLSEIDMAAFEDAVADIEQYMEQKTKNHQS
jgi:hypothetical protein